MGIKRKFKRPVSWLAGRELLASLESILNYLLNGKKQDSRDWMFAQAITPPHCNDTQQEYWFDYIADTGDGSRAVYNVAYLCMSGLWLKDGKITPGHPISLSQTGEFNQQLPRGEFLFVGGDTAYHAADIAALKERFQTPFNWAYEDIAVTTGEKIDQRPIYGIPANHDYYDALDGFNRQFCRPIVQDIHPLVREQEDLTDPQLGLHGFRREQKSSYVWLNLPFGWRLWGLDSQAGKMDKRQQAFFVSQFCDKLTQDGSLFDENKKREVQETLRNAIPDKLIVATPEPSTVFGKCAASHAAMAELFLRLGLEPGFLHDGRLSHNKCRLDISGDVHHYERYWGNAHENGESGNYASVVAGGGGAFLHPSHTDAGEIKKQSVYPAEMDSHREVTQRILNPWQIFLGGYAWLIGAMVGFITYFAVTVPQSTWSLFKLIPDNLRPDWRSQDFLARIQIALTPPDADATHSGYWIDLIYLLLFVAFLVAWRLMSIPELLKVKYSDSRDIWNRRLATFLIPVVLWLIPLLILILESGESNPPSFLAAILIGLSCVAGLLIFSLIRCYSDILFERSRIRKEIWLDFIPLWVLSGMGIFYMAVGFLHYGIYKTSIMSFDLLVIVVWSLVILGLAAFPFFAPDKLGVAKANIGKFLAIGLWHAILQISIPVCLALYVDWTSWLIICGIAIAITLIAGHLFTSQYFFREFSADVQKKIGQGLLIAWIVIGIVVFFATMQGELVVVDASRLLMAFLSGAIFGCIWLGWYLAVSLAFNCHNNEAGGGARSEKFRHMVRIKLTEDTLTGYVIGIDAPEKDISKTKICLVDVFTLQAKK
ncbi:hypothetical protein [Nitrosomonas ureae]|uniref:Calcineurin-like phosphoesterase n=1 Tax=Nitrosomonas ureae TaxID=44577 RepID=A0A1H2E0S0_9PROT|nr:hypothetical protein [Nitrosomonas ureae]ALQ52366.1 hypothetical protein ATY38_14805 [Nitrosomonas ureae]SDT88742.1 hypothetical protein SAMN05216406_10819 [Nitrosomonas ureae]